MTKPRTPAEQAAILRAKKASPWSRGPNCATKKAKRSYLNPPKESEMSSQVNGRHSAFPGTRYSDDANLASIAMPGLTKREYFAAMAMQGMVANATLTTEARKLRPSEPDTVIALCAVAQADALLAALEGEGK